MTLVSPARVNQRVLVASTADDPAAPLELAVALPHAIEPARRVSAPAAQMITPVDALARSVALPPDGPQGPGGGVEVAVVGRPLQVDEIVRLRFPVRLLGAPEDEKDGSEVAKAADRLDLPRSPPVDVGETVADRAKVR